MACIDHNRHNPINNACISQEAATCLIAVMNIQKIWIARNAQNICSLQAYAFYFISYVAMPFLTNLHVRSCVYDFKIFFPCSLIAKMKVL